jgi:cbb3-type cytochrome oxidase subunit 3
MKMLLNNLMGGLVALAIVYVPVIVYAWRTSR